MQYSTRLQRLTTTHLVPCPRYIATDLAQQVLAKEDFNSAVLDRTPAGRVGKPDEVAGATLSAVVLWPSCLCDVSQRLRLQRRRAQAWWPSCAARQHPT